ncbi:group IIF secretory phospholipase A2-like [Mya arenaria]|uniref:group IIF secretory phospholipase A2-like n=1 Tax=Mya arenaria TaxID=6604 RepID=UPI0022E05823|nr:group IIF secretory phospholipase A2-like [Mya arenaria]
MKGQRVLVSLSLSFVLLLAVNGSAIDFARMIKMRTGNAPAAYIGYGNYCGFRGKGHATDRIDWCCREHDLCLEHSNNNSCRALSYFSFYLLDYKWAMYKGAIVCSQKNVGCKAVLCECDRMAAECIADNNRHYNKQLKKPIIHNVFNLAPPPVYSPQCPTLGYSPQSPTLRVLTSVPNPPCTRGKDVRVTLLIPPCTRLSAPPSVYSSQCPTLRILASVPHPPCTRLSAPPSVYSIQCPTLRVLDSVLHHPCTRLSDIQESQRFKTLQYYGTTSFP